MKKIIVGDDRLAFFQDKLEETLYELGLKIDFVDNPCDLLAKVRKQAETEPYFAVVTDNNYCCSPKGKLLDGFYILKKIDECTPKLKTPVRILFTLADYDKELEKKALKKGATHIVNNKDINKLKEILASYL